MVTTIFGFEQFGLKTVLAGIAFAYAGSMLYAWRKMADRRKLGLPMIGHTLHLKLTGAMVLVLVLDAVGYFIAVSHVPTQDAALITMLEDIFVVVALLTIGVGLVLPGMIAHTAVEISDAAEKLVKGTLADFNRAMQALAAGDFEAAKANFKLIPVMVHSHDEMSDMAENFNKLQEEIGSAALGLEGAREGLLKSQNELTQTNELLRIAEKRFAEEQIERLRNEHAVVLSSVVEGIHWLDADGKIKYENPASAKMLGYEVAELIGKPAHMTMHHKHADGSIYLQTQCPIYATLHSGVTHRVKDDVFWRKDGTSFPVEYTCTPVLDDKGHPKGCVVLFTDITERKKAEEELRKTFSDLQMAHDQLKQVQVQLLQSEKMASIGQLAAGVAHEINNPVGFISNNMEMLEQYTSDYAKILGMVEELKKAIEEERLGESENHHRRNVQV